jgi:predicted metal-dependent peptidase
LPPGALFAGQGPYADLPTGLSAEEYCAQLPGRKKHGGGDGDGNDDADGDGGDGGNDPGKCGGVEDAGDQAAQQEAEAEWKVAVAQAATAAKQRGELPGGLARMVSDIVEPKVLWQDVLREFVSRSLTARDDYSWSAPNRRFIAQGVYLPSLRSESMGAIVVAIDTSGSIGEAELKEFAGELNGILDCRPCSVSIVYCDADVNKVVEWEPSDGPLALESCGGGGTSHHPVWEWLRNQESQPERVVCLTDGYTCWGDDPGLPVLWALTADSRAEPPFGQTVRMGK